MTPFLHRLSWSLAAGLVLSALLHRTAAAQVPSGAQLPPGTSLPPPAVAEALLKNRPDLVAQLRERIGASGLTREQIRSRLRAAGYPETLLDPYLEGADTTKKVVVNNDIVDATRVLGIVGNEEADSLLDMTDSARAVADSLRADSLADTSSVLRVFGLSIFRRASTQFSPIQSGPVDRNYRLGPGDQLTLILTGDVEVAHELTVTREGFVAIPQVGQLNVANLTMAQFEDLLYTRLSRVYSGVRRTNPTTRFSVSVSRLRTVQVFVTGDVTRPGSYQISAAGTAMNALYAAGGPTANGSFRRVEIRRGGDLVDTLDLYDYLLRGDNRHDIRLETGDVVFVPVHGTHVKLTGAIVRPAIYELKGQETLRDLIQGAGGFQADALRRRVQIDRILPPAQRLAGGKDRVVLDIASDQLIDGFGPPLPMAPGDSVTVLKVAERRRDLVTVVGNVYTPGLIGYSPGMKVSDAIRLAGGPKQDTYLGQILVSRLQADSTRQQLRTAFRDSTGAVTDDFGLEEDDEITVYSRSTFRPVRYIAITGAVRKAGRVPYREGMTIRDAILEAEGLTEDALLSEAEIARMPEGEKRSIGQVATTFRVQLDSTYVFDRGPGGRYLGPPGAPAPAAGAPEVTLKPYDNVLIFRQPDWELQRTVSITGQVRFPGRYSLLTRTDRLLDLIQRAGGLTREAYPAGIKFFRSVDRGGRIGVDLPRVIKEPRFRDNLILSGGDSIVIPEYTPVVYVNGAVNAPMSVTYVPGRNLEYYIAAAGGFNRKADKNRSYVTQPNGKVESIVRRWWFAGDTRPKPLAGAAVFVPERDPADRKDWVVLAGSIAQILASLTAVVVVVAR
ncbi:MAG TPA: SLBB domain-containing protein [Gemmatimonadales bacterium]|nr:SLBB domain-containing protein [Gemmatimonadales bacterium]